MEEKKKLFDISWQVDEPTYRNDPALSQSTLARFERDGFSCIDKLFDKIETPSLTYGSAVDALLTGGEDEFNSKFFVANVPTLTDKVEMIAKELFELYGSEYKYLSDIPRDTMLTVINKWEYQKNWKPETRAKVIIEQAENYYNILYIANGKKIVNCEFVESVRDAVRAVRESPATSKYFIELPFSNYTNEYQLKFSTLFNNVPYRGMMDCLHIDWENKTVQLCDLKTTGHPEYKFFESFIKWRYDIQARLYWRLVADAMHYDEYWNGFKLLPSMKFLVVNKDSLTPLCWEFKDAHKYGTLKYGDLELRDPFDIGIELQTYLDDRNIKVPLGISESEPNDIVEYLTLRKND